ncbi:MAG: sigma-70 family RNA polymerase sigma factor [Anaerolineae bacterium]
MFEQWYQHDSHRLFNYIAYRVSDRATAEDLMAQACEKAVRHLDQYDPARGTMNAWMFGIGREVLRDHFRRVGRLPLMVPLADQPPVISRGATPEERAERADQFRRVMAHMNRLNPDEQEAVALRYGGALTYKEIAALLGTTTNRVGVLLHRAINKLREALLAEEAEND